MLFRRQPEIEEETGEFDDDGNPKMRRRKADDEYVIRKGILDARLIDAVIALPLNIFYGAGVPACLLILRKDRPAERRDKVLLVYAARHYRELSNKNQLRPQDVMRILVHYHAYGDAQKARALVKLHGDRLQRVISEDEIDEVGLVTAEFEKHATRLEELEAQLTKTQQVLGNTAKKTERAKVEGKIKKLQAAIEKQRKELAKRDEQIAEARKRAEEERQAIHTVGEELVALYAEPSELMKHARVVDFVEIEENEFNSNIPRYVATFDPEEPIDVNQALADLQIATQEQHEAQRRLRDLLRQACQCRTRQRMSGRWSPPRLR